MGSYSIAFFLRVCVQWSGCALASSALSVYFDLYQPLTMRRHEQMEERHYRHSLSSIRHVTGDYRHTISFIRYFQGEFALGTLFDNSFASSSVKFASFVR